MKFVAVLEPKGKCNLGCNGTGTIHYRVKRGTKSVVKLSICRCCVVTLLSRDPDEALEQLAEITGRPVWRRGNIVTPSEFIDDIKRRIRK